MSSKILILLFISVGFNYECVVGSRADCVYTTNEFTGYGCELKIEDSAIVSSFTEIGGVHQEGKNDDDVVGVWVYNEVRTNDLPLFLCERFRKVNKLFFQRLQVNELPENSFENCKDLRELIMKSRQFARPSIRKLPAKLLAENTKLRVFEANLQELESLPKNFFENQHELVRLNLRENKIGTFSSDFFKPLVNLEELILSKNSITKINPAWFVNLDKLTTIYLPDNNIQDIPRNAFTSLKNLKELWLSFNKISTIHSDSFGHHKLIHLNLMNNQINSIDEKFVDNVFVSDLLLLSNKCVNEQFLDDSESRSQIKNGLKTCFENYQPRVDVEERHDDDTEVEETTENLAALFEGLESMVGLLQNLAEMFSQLENLANQTSIDEAEFGTTEKSLI